MRNDFTRGRLVARGPGVNPRVLRAIGISILLLAAVVPAACLMLLALQP